MIIYCTIERRGGNRRKRRNRKRKKRKGGGESKEIEQEDLDKMGRRGELGKGKYSEIFGRRANSL